MEDRGAFKVATQNDAPDEARRARYGVLGDTVNYLAQERRMHTVLSKFGMLECFTSLSWGCREGAGMFISAHFLLPDPRQKNGKRLNPDTSPSRSRSHKAKKHTQSCTRTDTCHTENFKAEQEFYCRAVFGPKEPSFILQSFKIAMAIMANPFQLAKTYLFKTGAHFRD